MASDPSAFDRISILEADITTLDVDAIVNAANDALALGGGVCGAIHRAAGPQLAKACAAIGGCATGDARITPGFALKARYVIHAVGPIWQGGKAGEPRLLAGAYTSSLVLAEGEGCRTVAFPAISTGIYGYPAQDAARVAVEAIAGYLATGSGLERVVLCCFGEASCAVHAAALSAARAGRR